MGVLAEPLFRFLFTSKWLPAVPYFQVLCLGGILYPLHAYNLNILNVKGRSDLFLRLEIIKKVLIVLMIFGTLRFGIMGLIWGQLISTVLAFFINTHFSGRFIKYNAWQQAKDVLPLILIAFISGFIVWSTDNALKDFNDISRLLAGGSVGVCTYLGITALLKVESLYEFKKIILKK
jgi:O-antigen/teichoic acid export membrane protein